MPFTALKGKAKRLHAEGRLIVRRVRRLNAETVEGQATLFDTWRHHAVFVTSPYVMLQAEAQHRQHAVHEQVNADAKSAALAHLPSSSFQANAAWATLWAITHNLTHTAGVLASSFHARATTATIRAHLISIPAKIASSAHRIIPHMPTHWPRQNDFHALQAAVRPASGPGGWRGEWNGGTGGGPGKGAVRAGVISSPPGSRSAPAASAARTCLCTACNCLTCPWVNERTNVPSVDGARTPVKTRSIAPRRNRFRSSMLSAPATMPASTLDNQVHGELKRLIEHHCSLLKT